MRVSIQLPTSLLWYWTEIKSILSHVSLFGRKKKLKKDKMACGFRKVVLYVASSSKKCPGWAAWDQPD